MAAPAATPRHKALRAARPAGDAGVKAAKRAGSAGPAGHLKVKAERKRPGAIVAKPAKNAGAVVAAAPATTQAGVRQRAENDYRHALDALQEGRVAEAIGLLEQALVTDPRHQPSRETLIRLLMENNRQEDAAKQLRLALTLDPQQPAMAMLLARLQVEKGGPAIETLMRSLPSAANSGEYQAFLAALLQRAQRNKEAVEHYQVALRIAPQNGVWWMGLGISLQAEQRLPEAREAFTKARDTGALSAELQSFVERRLSQLSH